jgi:transcriptional repressor NrdR
MFVPLGKVVKTVRNNSSTPSGVGRADAGGLPAATISRNTAESRYIRSMICPFCRVDNDRVIDSRTSQDGLAIRRRRECLHCKRRFTTYERVEEMSLKVIKKDGNRVPFEREKIKRGLEKACWKRPIGENDVERVVTNIENEVYKTYDSEIPSGELGELVMRHLRRLDQIAYVRFASVYREFKDVREFVSELEPMLDDKDSS